MTTRHALNVDPAGNKSRRLRRLLATALVSLVASPVSAAIGIDVNASRTSTTSSTPRSAMFSTNADNELLLAFIATGRSGGSGVSVGSVAGGGLTWVLVVRTNGQRGTSEIWRAFSPTPLTNVTVTATLSQSTPASVTIVSFTGVDTTGADGSAAIGAVGSNFGSTGGPTATLVTTRNNSWVFGVGNDTDNAIARTPGFNQTLIHQSLTASNDTYWVQRQNNPTPVEGTAVTINDTSPLGDRWNLSICEVLAAPVVIPQTFGISGNISPPVVGSGALVTLSGAAVTTTADAAGNYTFVGIPNGTYTVLPSKIGTTFSPPSQLATVNGSDVTGINFTGQPVQTTWTLSGTITPPSAGSGATVTLSGTTVTTIADAAGNYSFSGLANNTYLVVPSKAGFTFTPANRSVIVNGADVTGVDFTGQAPISTFSITGMISPAASGSGTRLILGETGDVFADSLGNYRFVGIPNGTYTIIPSKAGFTFSPGSQQVTVNGADLTGVNFTAQAADQRSVVGEWGAPIELGLVAVNMVMMHTGKVLMYSGVTGASSDERVWDPLTGTMTLVPNPNYDLFCSGNTHLADGRILVAGGHDPAGLGARNANIFDPITQTWSALPNMTFRRWYPSATTLPDGRALVTSGAQTCLTCLADVPEIFDPATGLFTTVPTARLGIPYYPFMFVLPNGKLVNAGANENAAATSTLDLTTRTWTTVDPNVKDGHSAAMYEPGKILKSGTAADSGTAGNAAATAFVIDMTQSAPAWRQVASMAFPRAFHNTTLLPDGNVLVTGGGTALDGYDITKAIEQAELWSPASETWQTLASASIPRLYHSTALLLPDARVLTAGSGKDGPGIDQTRAEIYSPPYLFKGPRPSMTAAPAMVQYGSAFTVETPDATGIAKVTFVRPGAVTHAFDENQRLLSLSFTAGVGSITVQAPANANLAPPGYYMLFLVSSVGVPSVASWVLMPAPGVDAEPPTPPTGVSAAGAIGSATVTWTASTDNTGVALYNIHRSLTPGFAPSALNRVGQATTTTFTDISVPSGTYYYVVTAQDVALNVSAPSNEASAVVFADTTPPIVAVTTPADGQTVTGSIAVSASASDDVAVASVQFTLDDAPLGAPRATPPYSITWNTTTTSNGLHTVAAIASDGGGNTAQSAVTVVVSNTAQTPNGLVAAYGFNEAAGDVQVTDASGQGNTGTISGATRTAAGKFGGALSFNGTSAWVTVADAPSLDLTTGITVSAWVQPTSITGWRSVVLKESTGGLAYALYGTDDTSHPAGYINVNVDIAATAPATLALNAWTHLAFTYDGAMMRMFVNGVQVRTTAVSGAALVTNGVLRIGGNSIWGEYFRGIIDEVRIYNRPLSAAEIVTDMSVPIP